jgi:signal transduction histidine kinase
VSTLSHELRTPLNAVVGWIGVLKQDPTPENIERGLDVIDRNLLRQTQMIDELLDMSRIISGKMRLEMEAVDLSPVVEAVASASPAATAKGVMLSTAVEPAPASMATRAGYSEIVWNLVTNAVKFTPRGGRVQVTLREEGGQAVLDVSDTGIGIEPHFLPHIFQRFRQADASVTREHGGLGLGLAIVKSLVEMHGGSADAASEGRGKGSVFRVNLPLALELAVDSAPAPPALPPSPELHPALTGLRVLIVDDESDAREVAQWFLESAGADASGVGSVDEALALLDDGLVPDVIVSDIGLPRP